MAFLLAFSYGTLGWLLWQGGQSYRGAVLVAFVGLTCILIPVVGVFIGVLAYQISKARRTLYLVTTERVICCEPQWQGNYQFHECGPERLRFISHRGWDNLLGAVTLPHGGMGPILHPRDVFELIVKAFLPKLPGQLKNPDNEIRRQAILTMKELAVRRQMPVTTLVVALHSDDSFIRQSAAAALGEIGRDAEIALSALRTATFDENVEVSQAAFQAIDAIRGELGSIKRIEPSNRSPGESIGQQKAMA